MAKIKSIEYFRVLPRWLFVKICDEDGGYGWGEATLEGHTEAVEGTLNAMIKRYVGYEADNIEFLWQDVYRASFYRGGPTMMSALSGIDIALWDLKGNTTVSLTFPQEKLAAKAQHAAVSRPLRARRLGVPIYQLLGGKVRDKVKVYPWIGGHRPSEVEEAAKARIAQGFKAIKMNATSDIDWLDSPLALTSSITRLQTVQKLGLDVALDFHGRLHKPMAKQLAKLVEPYHPLFIEEPLLSEHPEGIAQLSKLTTTPIALGERLYSRWDVKRFLQDTSVDVLQPDVAHCGGLSELKRIAAMAEAYDVAIAPHCPLGPIALAACMQFALSTQNFVIQEMSLGIHYNTEAGEHDITNYVKDPSVWDVKDGYVEGLKGVGLGIEVDEEEVRMVAKTAKPWFNSGFVGPDGAIREW